MTATVDSPPRHALWEHQAEALRFAEGKPGVLLAHGMGGGKTRTTIELLETTDAMRVLVLCPKSVTGVWPDQITQHATRDWHTWNGLVLGARGPLNNPTVAKRAEALIQQTTMATKIGLPFAAVVNYEASWQGQMAAAIEGTPWDVLVCDESHRLKSPGGKASRFAAKLAKQIRARGGRVIALTGTPMPHTPLDIFAQMRVIDPEPFGYAHRPFVQRYGQPQTIYVAGGKQQTIYTGIRPERMGLFTEQLAGVMHQVRQDDLDRSLGLAEPTDLYRTCQLSPATRKVYDRLERDLIAEIDGGVVTAANAMVLVLRLAQATQGFARDADTGDTQMLCDPPEKAALLADLLEDIDEPVVVFCRFRHDLDQVERIARDKGRTYGELSGRRRDGLTSESRMADVDILGAQLQSGGVGIDLTRASVGVYFSLDFKLAEHDQSRKRLHRPGQKHHVRFIHLLAEDTVDQAVFGALGKRREVINAVLRTLNPKEGTP